MRKGSEGMRIADRVQRKGRAERDTQTSNQRVRMLGPRKLNLQEGYRYQKLLLLRRLRLTIEHTSLSSCGVIRAWKLEAKLPSTVRQQRPQIVT